MTITMIDDKWSVVETENGEELRRYGEPEDCGLDMVARVMLCEIKRMRALLEGITSTQTDTRQAIELAAEYLNTRKTS